MTAQRTFRFRHTGNLQTEVADARRASGMTIDYHKHIKVLADRLALEPISYTALEPCVLPRLWMIDEDTG